MQRTAPPKSGSGATFKIAITIVLMIGLGELIAIIWALIEKQRGGESLDPVAVFSPPAVAITSTPASVVAPPPPPPVLPRAAIPIPSRFPPPAPPAARPVAPKTPNRGGELLLPESQRIRDPLILESIADGIRLRDDGDAQGALTRFRNAAAVIGDHPVTLAELGRTYEIMGLRKKAIDCWERIYRMGEAGAGDYFVIADVRLRGLEPQADSAAGSRRLRFEPVSEERKRDLGQPNEDGETILLRIPIHGIGRDPIAASEVSVYVYFYDQVNGQQIEQSTADPPRSSWRTLPIDWQSEDPEIFEIIYHHPALSAQQIRELGRRSYFGYVLKLYYQDQLQDILAKPRLLLDYAPATTAPQINDILFR